MIQGQGRLTEHSRQGHPAQGYRPDNLQLMAHDLGNERDDPGAALHYRAAGRGQLLAIQTNKQSN